MESTKEVEFSPGHQQEVKILFGFALHGGRHFFASEEAALLSKLPFSDTT
jgi:hypothetical protein